jgi:hypothetical protein
VDKRHNPPNVVGLGVALGFRDRTAHVRDEPCIAPRLTIQLPRMRERRSAKISARESRRDHGAAGNTSSVAGDVEGA